ncbi:MAG: patatin family protein [Lachnospiraceae bacterium]|nr:patatin family protein [Lachnospiraceae bacterium]
MAQEKKTGLVLEGGAMRGMYTAGVLDVFMENGIEFDGVIGVSAGAICGCSFVSGQVGRTIRYNKSYCTDKRFMSFYSLLTTGDLVGDKFCYHTIPEELDPYDNEAFLRSKTKFYSVCTNLETGEPEYILMKDMVKDIDYLRASASMPYVSRTVEKDGMKLLDGGCSDSIPVRAFMNMGYEKNVVVLTRPADYRKKPEKKGLARIFYRKYPKFVKRLATRPEEYNKTVEDIMQLEQEGKIFVIRPKRPLEIGRMSHDVKEIIRTYERGRSDAFECLEEMKAWLMNNK